MSRTAGYTSGEFAPIVCVEVIKLCYLPELRDVHALNTITYASIKYISFITDVTNVNLWPEFELLKYTSYYTRTGEVCSLLLERVG